MIQEQILNKVLQDKDISIITLNNLTTDYFPENRNEFWFIKQHYDQYGVVPDKETFLEHFPDFEIIEQVNEPTQYLLQQLIKDKQKRFLAETFNKIRGKLMSGRTDEDIDSAVELLREAAEKSTDAVVLNAHDIIHDTSRYDGYVDMATNLDKYYTKTGFKELDDIIGGWNKDEDLVTIVARNGVGKSWILLKCACAAAMQGKNVGLYSGEMGLDAVGFRADTLIGGISNGALVHGSLSIKNEYRRFLDSLNEKVPGKIYVLTPEDIGSYGKASTFRAFIEKYKLDLLCIDQNSLLDDDRNAKNPVEKAQNISTDLKLLQRLKQIPIICVNQQNRTKNEDSKDGKKQFDTTQVAGADKIAQDSSIVIFLEREADLMRLHLTKSRNTEANQVLTYRIDLNTGKFTYVVQAEGDGSAAQGYSEEDVF